jgi:hypothetical protein
MNAPHGDIILRVSDGAFLHERIGCLGASELNDAADFTKAGKSGAARMRLLKEKVAERMNGRKEGRYVTPPMQRGIDNQEPATQLYEMRRGVLVKPEATVRHASIEHFLATPDMWIPPDGLGEIKVPLASTYWEWVEAGEVPEQHKLQMIGQVACSGRKWVDFVAYCPEAPQNRDLFVRRFVPTPEQIEEVETIARAFLREVEVRMDRVLNQEMIA